MKYKEESDSSGFICPYCKGKQLCDDWDYEYDGEKTKCDHCDKYFFSTVDHSVVFRSTPDCEMNNLKHDFVFHSNRSGRKAYFCSICGECKLED